MQKAYKYPPELVDARRIDGYRKAMATCPEGMWPAVYEVNGETERERVILNIANNLPNKYQKECKLQLRPVLLTSPQPTSTALSDVRTCVTAQDAQAKNTTNPAAAGLLGTCVYTDMELAQLFIRRVPVRRKGQQVYTFNGTYYRPLTESELHIGYSVRAKASAVPKTASHFPPGFAPSWRQSFRQREARDVLEEFPAMAIWECS